MSEPVGYVLLEWNQAGQMPGFAPFPTLHQTREDAEYEAGFERERAKTNHRRERYAVAEVRLLEDPS